uniref:Uncharacterized protein n=1 Tax=Tanacetum cinerariifolium TaxID=118510 RepID=A0A699RQ06_TANCI|nr:hypothetical protein [Tanacetum cinerariifolium]
MLDYWFKVLFHKNYVGIKFRVDTLDIRKYPSDGSLVGLKNHYKSSLLLHTQIFNNDDWKLVVTFQECIFEADNFLEIEGVMDHHSGMLLIEVCPPQGRDKADKVLEE